MTNLKTRLYDGLFVMTLIGGTAGLIWLLVTFPIQILFIWLTLVGISFIGAFYESVISLSLILEHAEKNSNK